VRVCLGGFDDERNIEIEKDSDLKGGFPFLFFFFFFLLVLCSARMMIMMMMMMEAACCLCAA
jgi:hypothetical protein